jgi:hypothetical protein
MIAHMHHIGMVISNSFDVDDVDPAIKGGLDWAVMNGLKRRMLDKMPTMAKNVNGWLMNTDAIRVYGNYYLKWAIVVMVGLGANQPKDSIYPLNVADADGQPRNAAYNYVVLHFEREEIPPMEAFWLLHYNV